MHATLLTLFLACVASCSRAPVVSTRVAPHGTLPSHVLAQQLEKDVLTLRVLRSNGSDLARPHELEHHFVCPDRTAAERVVGWAAEAGCRAEAPIEQEHGGERYFTCDLVRTAVPELESITAQTTGMLEAALRFGVEYDGWGCDIVR